MSTKSATERVRVWEDLDFFFLTIWSQNKLFVGKVLSPGREWGVFLVCPGGILPPSAPALKSGTRAASSSLWANTGMGTDSHFVCEQAPRPVCHRGCLSRYQLDQGPGPQSTTVAKLWAYRASSPCRLHLLLRGTLCYS